MRKEMKLTDSIKEERALCYYWHCVGCGKTIGPSVSRKRVVSLAEQHVTLKGCEGYE